LRFWEHDVEHRLQFVVRRIHRRVVQKRSTLKRRRVA
jgi:hypothetical protein